MAVTTAIAGRRRELPAVAGVLTGETDAVTMLVAGEAGVGKSRLVAAAAAVAAQANMTVLTGWCLPLSQGLPLLPVVDLLRGLGELDEGRLLNSLLSDCPAFVRGEVVRLMPELDESGGQTRPAEPDDGWRRQRLFDALRRLLSALAEVRRVAVVVEDVQWADPTTLEFLDYLLAPGSASGVPLVLTCRTGEESTQTLADWLDRLHRDARVRRLDLSALTQAETAEQIALLLGRRAPGQFADEVYLRSEGNAFFTERLVAFDRTDGEHPTIREPLPAGLTALLLSRTAQVTGPTRDVMVALAVAARPMQESALARLCRTDEAAVRAALWDLLSARLLRRPDRAGRHQLRHALLAEAVNGELLPGERRELHAQVAELMAGWPDAGLAAEVAAHFAEAEVPTEELRWRVAAGREAEAVFASREAAAHWRRAITLWDQVPEPDVVARLDLAQLYLRAATAPTRAWPTRPRSHLVGLGVTAVELLPVHHNVPERFLRERGLTNYWGYNTIGYFAPHAGYSAAVRAGRPGGQVAEFQAMVDTLHGAGLEVLLDVVFNHTAEGDHLGPTLCFRGLDNPAYYWLDPADPSRYVDTTGCGNSLNAGSPVSLQLIMDSLRYWMTEMGVDGFRFDLAPTLARQEGGFDKLSAFFDLVSQDPAVSRAKLIAEPWDVGRADTYDVGRFPPLWSEWNGRYRDVMRDFWRSHGGLIGEVASRLSGSADLYSAAGRRPTASVNFITVHDGFALADLISYNSKHNDANGEANRDGTDDNRSWNCGAEGPTTDPGVLDLRARQRRAMLTTLLLSFGIPMLQGGDELGRTQQGNNNAYCQDNAISWFDWSSPDQQLIGFTKRLITLRRNHPVFRRRRFLTGVEATELRWYTPAGDEMTPADWGDPAARSIAVYLDGADDPDPASDGTPLVDDDFLLLVNAWWQPLDFTLPATRPDLTLIFQPGGLVPVS